MKSVSLIAVNYSVMYNFQHALLQARPTNLLTVETDLQSSKICFDGIQPQTASHTIIAVEHWI